MDLLLQEEREWGVEGRQEESRGLDGGCFPLSELPTECPLRALRLPSILPEPRAQLWAPLQVRLCLRSWLSVQRLPLHQSLFLQLLLQ